MAPHTNIEKKTWGGGAKEKEGEGVVENHVQEGTVWFQWLQEGTDRTSGSKEKSGPRIHFFS